MTETLNTFEHIDNEILIDGKINKIGEKSEDFINDRKIAMKALKILEDFLNQGKKGNDRVDIDLAYDPKNDLYYFINGSKKIFITDKLEDMYNQEGIKKLSKEQYDNLDILNIKDFIIDNLSYTEFENKGVKANKLIGVVEFIKNLKRIELEN